MATAMIRVVLDGSREERIYESRLAQARLPSYHDSKGGASLCDDLVAVIGQ